MARIRPPPASQLPAHTLTSGGRATVMVRATVTVHATVMVRAMDTARALAMGHAMVTGRATATAAGAADKRFGFREIGEGLRVSRRPSLFVRAGRYAFIERLAT